MGFLGVYRALYDYVPQAQGELAIQEKDLLYVLEKDGGDGWWKAKKKAGMEDEEEPEGLVPHNYVEEVCCIMPLLERQANQWPAKPWKLTIITRHRHYAMLERSMNTLVRQTRSCPSRKMLYWKFSIPAILTGF